MSQAKVDRYKEEKAKRFLQKKKENVSQAPSVDG